MVQWLANHQTGKQQSLNLKKTLKSGLFDFVFRFETIKRIKQSQCGSHRTKTGLQKQAWGL